MFEKVNPSHPDKVADRIAGAIVDLFYYEKAPEQVRIMVNGMNLDGLAELYKVTKDRRI